MRVFLLLLVSLTFSCKNKDQNAKEDLQVVVDSNLPSNDTLKLLSKYPELKLFNSEIVESRTRTAYIVQNSSFSIGIHEQRAIFEDYKCKSIYKNDTLEIWLNNNNGYFGNGILVQVFNHKFKIKNIDPKTLRNEIKFIAADVLNQKLVLNKSNFKRNDSIYGFVNYTCSLDYQVKKHFRGYFKTLIQ
ncbi:hypothetical protein QWZ06_26425 [Chryseobacterium tructae]|uniref:DUF4468 domain-containing protein n=1 Tax=Chryseobacterium tructae TaxID=1037380 RepID=A0ABV7XPB8_9FLAO|nr:hypothetical protein [Chryseobacterium tructae]MDN3695513.1 hypothetical protein [Chryseobacterium tructae]